MKPLQGDKVFLTQRCISALCEIGAHYRVSGLSFRDWPYSRDKVLDCIRLDKNASEVLSVSDAINQEGYVIASLESLLREDDSLVATVLTMVLAVACSPLRVFELHPFWRRLNVDLERPPNRSCGQGFQPLHIDFVNAQNPPDYVALFCVRPDPYGGGASLLSDIDGVSEYLTPEQREALEIAQYSDGTVKALAGIGHDSNPFPVISNGGAWRCRFTSNLLNHNHSEEVRRALQAFHDIAEAKMKYVILGVGDLLIFNQHKFLHGRGQMGGNQQDLSEEQRRLLLQAFGRI